MNAATATRPARDGLLRTLSVLLRAAAGGLVAFHLWLLVHRLADASIGDPQVLLRWFGATLLGFGALAIHRRGLPLLSGRSGLVFWLLVLLLHVGASPVPANGIQAQEILIVLPLGMAIGSGCFARTRPAARLARSAEDCPPRRGWRDFTLPPRRPRHAGLAVRFVPRPPPLLVPGV